VRYDQLPASLALCEPCAAAAEAPDGGLQERRITMDLGVQIKAI